MKCPVCREDMLIVEYSEIEIDCCSQCGGVWFDGGELEALLEKSGGDRNTLSLEINVSVNEAVRKCPHCRKGMQKVGVGPGGAVTADRCEIHGGLWFDAGELGKALSGVVPENGRGSVLDFLASVFPAKQEEEKKR